VLLNLHEGLNQKEIMYLFHVGQVRYFCRVTELASYTNLGF
jgi:hypothetical protein